MAACSWCQRTRLPEASVQLLDGALFPETPIPGSMRLVLTDLRDRQEELFMQVLDKQKQFHKQLLDVNVAVQANIDAQLVSQRCQEELLAKFDRLSLKAGVLELTGDSIQTPAADEAHHGDNGSSDTGKDLRLLLKSMDLKSIGPEMRRDPIQTSGACEADLGVNDSPGAAKEFGPTASSFSANTPPIGEGTTGNSEVMASEPRNTLSLNTSRFSILSNEFTFGPQSKFQIVMRSKQFEFAVAMLIMANALIMCVESQYQGLDVGFDLQFPGRPVEAHIVWAGADTVFKCFDWIFGCLFFVEVILKLRCWGRSYFYFSPPSVWDLQDQPLPRWMLVCWKCCSGVQGWNLLDFSCVVAFCLDKMAPGGAIDPQTIRLLRLFRLFRMARLLRFLETMDNLYIMTTAIAGVRHVLFWAIMLLAIMLLMCDLLLVQILHATYFDRVKAEDLTEHQLLRHHEMYEYFGTCTRCLLSMFELTLGNWPPVVRLLSEEASEWFTLICLLHKLTIGFAVINVISGVIMQQTFKVAQTDDMKAIRRKLKALFRRLDTSGDGRLEMSEVEELSNLPEVKIWLGSKGIETDDIGTLFKLIDENGDGYITFDEMMSQMPRLQGNARSIDLFALRHLVHDHMQMTGNAFDIYSSKAAGK